jgi:hypothetical protein
MEDLFTFELSPFLSFCKLVFEQHDCFVYFEDVIVVSLLYPFKVLDLFLLKLNLGLEVVILLFQVCDI